MTVRRDRAVRRRALFAANTKDKTEDVSYNILAAGPCFCLLVEYIRDDHHEE